MKLENTSMKKYIADLENTEGVISQEMKKIDFLEYNILNFDYLI